MLSKLLLSTTLILALGTFSAAAQDRIHLKNGTTLEVKVQEVAPRTITYKKWDNREGPNYIINRNEVDRITYQNGSSEELEDGDGDDDRFPMRGPRRPSFPRNHSDVTYGNNILSLALVQMTNESAAGIGLHYERVLGKRQIFSFYLPVALSFVRDQYYSYNNNYSSNRHVFVNVYPGLKIYPTGNNGIVRYAVGPSLALGFGNKYRHEDVLDQSGQLIGVRTIVDDVFRTGLMINNSLNIMPTKNLYLGLELGLGFVYSTTEDNYNGYSTVDDVPLVQLNFKIGYRF